jgi:small conductance mechanosensitive channel
MSDLINKLTMFSASLAVVIVVAVLVYLAHMRLLKFYANKPSQQHYRQLIMICIWLFGLILGVLIMPVGDQMRGQLLGFVGILLSATIALSSTTIVGNAMAGLMLRSIRNCGVGDHITVGEHFGRISSMDLLHIEIQTEDRDLTTLPNLYVVTNPVTVLRESGTILHVEVSLGYDIQRQKIEAALIDAAERTGLEKPFVQIRHLGDFSVSYRVAGLLTDISKLIAARARLRSNTLDALHESGIEIMSPSLMVTRPLNNGQQIVPTVSRNEPEVEDLADPDELVFDKARQAEELEELKQGYTEYSQRLLELEQELKDAGKGDERRPLSLEKKKLEATMVRVARQIEALEADLREEKK